MSVVSYEWLGSDPGAPVIQLGPFVAVGGDAPQTLSFSLGIADGFEVPVERDVATTASLRGLGVGDRTAVGTLAPAPGVFSGVAPSVAPGLYFREASALDYPMGSDGDTTDYLSKYLEVASVSAVALEPVFDQARTGRLVFRVTTQDQGSHEITTAKHVWRDPDGQVMEATASVPLCTGTTSEEEAVVRVFPLAGTYTFGVAYRDDHADRYRDGLNRWARPGAYSLEIPAESIFTCTCDPALAGANVSLASHRHNLLGYIPPDPGYYEASFYSPVAPEGERDGLVLDPEEKGTVLAALQEDQIVSWLGHGWQHHLTLCSQDLTSSDILSLPSGSLGQVRLVWLTSCGGMYQGQLDCIGRYMADKGAGVVFGYKWYAYPVSGGGSLFERRAWEYLVDGQPMCQAVAMALYDVELAGYDLSKCGLADDPSTPQIEGWAYTNATAKIAPAFRIP